MKTFKQFQEDIQQLDEIAPLVVAGKVIGAGLAAYSAGSAINNLRKGKFKQAAFDALGAVPGGKAFKLARGLGASKNIARGASALQSANRLNVTGLTPNAYAKGVDKAYDVAAKGVGKVGELVSKNKNKKNKPNTTTNTTNTIARTNSVPDRILGANDFTYVKNPNPQILDAAKKADKKRRTV